MFLNAKFPKYAEYKYQAYKFTLTIVLTAVRITNSETLKKHPLYRKVYVEFTYESIMLRFKFCKIVDFGEKNVYNVL